MWFLCVVGEAQTFDLVRKSMDMDPNILPTSIVTTSQQHVCTAADFTKTAPLSSISILSLLALHLSILHLAYMITLLITNQASTQSFFYQCTGTKQAWAVGGSLLRKTHSFAESL